MGFNSGFKGLNFRTGPHGAVKIFWTYHGNNHPHYIKH